MSDARVPYWAEEEAVGVLQTRSHVRTTMVEQAAGAEFAKTNLEFFGADAANIEKVSFESEEIEHYVPRDVPRVTDLNISDG